MRTRQIEIQLSAVAQAADRRNRPTVVIVVAGLFMLAAIGYTAANFWNMKSQGARLHAAEQTGKRITDRIASIKQELARHPDYAAMFPAKTRYLVSLVDEASKVWPERTWTIRDIGSEKPSRGVPRIENLNRLGFSVTIKDEPIDLVLEFAERLVNGPEELFGKSFIATIDLQPEKTSSNWLSTVEIDRYEYRPPR